MASRVSAKLATTTELWISAVFREDRNRMREVGCRAPMNLLVQRALQAKLLATIATLINWIHDPDGNVSAGRIVEVASPRGFEPRFSP